MEDDGGVAAFGEMRKWEEEREELVREGREESGGKAGRSGTRVSRRCISPRRQSGVRNGKKEGREEKTNRERIGRREGRVG